MGYHSVHYIYICVRSSVADRDPVFLGHPDPDPDPGKYLIQIRILNPQKDPCSSNFLVIKLSKIQFRPNNLFFFDFRCHRMFRFGKKMNFKNIYFAKHKKHM